MSAPVRVLLVVSFFALALSACRHLAPGNELTAFPPQLLEWEVLRMADDFATHTFIAQKWEKGAGLDLSYYPDRGPKYDPDAKRWIVIYHREPNRWPGDHFMISIDDVTREITYHGGL